MQKQNNVEIATNVESDSQDEVIRINWSPNDAGGPSDDSEIESYVENQLDGMFPFDQY